MLSGPRHGHLASASSHGPAGEEIASLYHARPSLIRQGRLESEGGRSFCKLQLERSGRLALFDAVPLLPEERPGRCKTEYGPGQLEFDDGPHPETTDGWCLLHDSQIPKCVGYVDQIAAGADA